MVYIKITFPTEIKGDPLDIQNVGRINITDDAGMNMSCYFTDRFDITTPRGADRLADLLSRFISGMFITQIIQRAIEAEEEL